MAVDPNTGIPDDTKRIQVPGYLRFGKVIIWLLYAWILFGIIMLGMRTFLLVTSANPTEFVNFVYRTSADFLEPFRGIFPPRTVGETGYLDVSAIFAILIYLILTWLISAGIKYIQAKIDILEEQEQERLARNRKRLEMQQQYDAGKEVVKETTYVRRPKPASSKQTSTKKRL